MNIKKIEVGYLLENCYIASIENDAVIVDPGDEFEKIVQSIGNLNIVAILITHYHFDHVGALEKIKNKYNVRIYDFKDKGKKENIGKFKFEIIDTKGHTDDSVTFYFEDYKIMFTGDFLFKESIGRTDFENSNYYDMMESIKLIKNYSDDIKIYPGHGDSSTLLHERENNVFYNIDKI